MDRIDLPKKLRIFLDKYKFVLLVTVLGLVLMVWPTKKTQAAPAPSNQTTAQPVSITEELSTILGQIRGVGRVRVMITEQSGSETHYQTDETGSESADSTNRERRTVLISSGGAEAGLVTSVSAPVYLGAIVVCQGADDPAVRLAVSQAVSSVTGISTDRISVLKMK